MVRFKVGEFVILLIYLSYLCFLMEYIDKTTQILHFNFLWKNFLSYFNSWAVKSLSLWLLLDNDANSHMKKLLLLINYWHKWSVYVNCSRYFIEINLNRSVGLNRYFEFWGYCLQLVYYGLMYKKVKIFQISELSNLSYK